MAIEQIPLRQLEADMMFPFTYSGKLLIEDTLYRLYNDTDRDRAIKFVRASVGVASAGLGIVVDLKKNGVSVFTPGASWYPHISGEYPPVYIPPGLHTATSVPMPEAVWSEGDYLTVSILQVGSTVAGSDLTISVVVSE